jgi:hypothetical protein
VARILDPAHRLDRDPEDDRAQDEGIQEGNQDADALVAEGSARIGRPASLAQSKNGEREDDDVGQDVAGIAEECEAVGQPTTSTTRTTTVRASASRTRLSALETCIPPILLPISDRSPAPAQA